MFIRNPYRGSFCGRMPITHSVARSFPQHCRGYSQRCPTGFCGWVSIRSKNTFLCLAGCRYKEASSNVRGGLPNVRSHHMSSAADAVGAPANRKNKKKAGDYLLSHIASHAVPSTQKSLTSEFGMGSGMASSLLSPARLKKRF